MKTNILIFASVATLTIMGIAQVKTETPTAGTTPMKIGAYTFHYASPWNLKEPKRPMSQGGLHYGKSGEPGTVAADFYHFGGGQGGSTAANVERWMNQFAKDGLRSSKTEKLMFAETEVTLVTIDGTYLSGPPMLPPEAKKKVPGQRLLGAIIPGEGGPVFIKMTGAKDAVTAAGKAFKKLVVSAFGE